MIQLNSFTEKDFALFKSWIRNERELMQFAGPIFTFPLTDEQLYRYISSLDKKPLKVVLSSTGEVIGHCELNFENSINRLSRVLIGDAKHRGKGIGGQIIIAMTDLFFENKKINEVDLNVISWNISAIKCYQKIGFKINQDSSEEVFVNGEKWLVLNMILKRDDYQKKAE